MGHRCVEFIEFLSGCCSVTDFQFNSDIEKFSLNTSDFESYVFFREEGYARNLVYRSEWFELLVLTWRPGHRAPIHDHNGQRCWTWMLSGGLLIKNYIENKNATFELMHSGIHKKGEAIYIDDGVGLHSIENISSENAISLHLYSKPIEKCKFFCETSKTFKVIQLKYFTVPVSYKGLLLSQ